MDLRLAVITVSAFSFFLVLENLCQLCQDFIWTGMGKKKKKKESELIK